MNKPLLRQLLLASRRELTRSYTASASNIVCGKLMSHPYFTNSKTIAFYAAHKNEVDLQSILRYAQRHGKSCYLPIAHPKTRLLTFAEVSLDLQFVTNRYGIREPIANSSNLIAPNDLDLVLVPLVGFDASGHRIGHGKGYYDYTFSFLNPDSASTKPKLLGIGYHNQQVIDGIPADPHDVKLDAIVTDDYDFIFRTRSANLQRP